MPASPNNLKNDLALRLARLAAAQETIGYGALARDLAIPGPGSIAKLTAALETLMRDDAAAGHPLRAALCAGRLSGDLPAAGFFDLAQALGCYDGQSPVDFVACERQRLWGAAVSCNGDPGPLPNRGKTA